MGYFWHFYRVNCICHSVFGPFWCQPYTHINFTLSIPDIAILSNIDYSSMVTFISNLLSRKSFPWKILRWRNFKIITGELGQNDLLKIIDYSTDNGRIGFRMMNFFHFVNHRNAFLFHRNHVINPYQRFLGPSPSAISGMKIQKRYWRHRILVWPYFYENWNWHMPIWEQLCHFRTKIYAFFGTVTLRDFRGKNPNIGICQ